MLPNEENGAATTHLQWPPWVSYSWGASGSERAAIARACVYRSRSWTDFAAEKHETLSKFVDEGGGNYKPDWLMPLEHGTYVPPPRRREEMGSFSNMWWFGDWVADFIRVQKIMWAISLSFSSLRIFIFFSSLHDSSLGIVYLLFQWKIKVNSPL